MINVLVAPDKFKGSVTARQVCAAIREGLLQRGYPMKITLAPLADGGEGTCARLTELCDGTYVSVNVNDPLFRPINATYGISADGATAFIEMATASGLELLSEHERNPAMTTSFGTGELIRHALDNKINHIILGIGGSATNDAGIGMAAALGFGFFDKEREPLIPIGANLGKLNEITSTDIHPRLRTVKFTTLCDVTNPLYGEHGAAHVYAPQKGADTETVQLLDTGLRNFDLVVNRFTKANINFDGAGAAGGMGAGASVFLNATMKMGMDYIITATRLEEKIISADIVVSGEGKLDQQSLSGKVVFAVNELARKHGKKMIVVCGVNKLPSEAFHDTAIMEVISLVDGGVTPTEAMNNAYALIVERARACKLQ